MSFLAGLFGGIIVGIVLMGFGANLSANRSEQSGIWTNHQNVYKLTKMTP